MDKDNKYYNLTNLGTWTITGKYLLVGIVVNKKGSSSSVANVYEDVAATPERKIGQIDTTSQLGLIEYNIPCPDGITVVTATGTAGDLTIIYRPLA